MKIKKDLDYWKCGDCDGTGRKYSQSHGAFGEPTSDWHYCGSCHGLGISFSPEIMQQMKRKL